MLTRIREILFPLLVIMIVASLWAVGRAQAMDEEVRVGVGGPRWTALIDTSFTPGE